jgi:hypothetical protein
MEEPKVKATRANLLGEFTGKLDGLIYYCRRSNGKLYVRRKWKFENHPGQAQFASAQRAIFALQPSEVYKRDLKDYLLRYNLLPENEGKQAQYWGNLYVKLMFALQKTYPETVDLANITREQIVSQNLPCRSIKAAVEAGLLPVVKGYERFVNEL